MPAFTASQASVTNNSKVVQINSGESIANVNSGDFLVLAGFIIEINRAYVGGDGKGYFELVKNWPNSNQTNQECIVIPTTGEFKKAVDALTSANVLVNDNFKAMQDWQTKTGSVTFANQDGTTTTVKTLKQIEADNQAQMNAYHPYPWAMRKVEFESIRAANNEKYAANGFIHFGHHYTQNNNLGMAVNEGLWTRTEGSNVRENTFFLGREIFPVNSNSKERFPITHIGGVVSNLQWLSNDPNHQSIRVKLPPAEDGTRTYNSATSESTIHASHTLAFASETDTNKVVLDREDLWSFELFLRKVTESDPFVYEKGLIQSLSSAINGVATSDDNIRPIEYFAWFEGDTTSRGKGVNWETASESQRIKIASDPYNNIYFDDSTGEFYQWCIRGRSFAGAGNGSWKRIDTTSDENLTFDNSTYVAPIGSKNSDLAFYDSDTNSDAVFYPKGKFDITFDIEVGVYQAGRALGKADSVAVDGECYLLVCGTVNRLNKGAKHPLNPQGASRLNSTVSSTAGRYWYQSEAIPPSTKEDLFNPVNGGVDNSTAGYAVGSGSISSGFSGREDERYYDAVYPSGDGGVCRDMRYSACGLTAEDFAEAELKIKSGEYRGIETLPFTQFYPKVNGEIYYKTVADGVGIFKVTDWDASPDVKTSAVGDYVGAMVVGNTTYIVDDIYKNASGELVIRSESASDFVGIGDVVSLLLYTHKQGSKVEVSGEYTYTEVIGNPAEILLCDDLKNGWIGGWCKDIPDGTSKDFKLTRPAQTSQSYTSPYTLDNGVNWTATPRTIDLITNSIQDVAWGVGLVTAISYKAKAKITHNSTNSKIFGNLLGVGSVFVSSRARDETARGLAFSLIDKVTTSQNISGVGTDHQYLPLNELQLGNGLDKLLGINQVVGQHGVISLATPQNNSPAFKALNYNVVESQQAFINYAYTELKHNGTDWGDDGKIHIADNQTTMLDENGNTVLVGTARCVEPLGWIKNDK